MPRRWRRERRYRRRHAPPPSVRWPTTFRTPTPRTTSRRTSPLASCRRSRRRQKARSSAIWRSRTARSRTCRHGFMHEHLKRFLQFLRLNRNASPHTVRAYDSDLSQFIAHAAAGAGIKRSELAPAQLNRSAIRRYLGELHAMGQTRASAARKLAAVRTFLRYLRREGVIEDDPGALVATPKRDVRMPAHL